MREFDSQGMPTPEAMTDLMERLQAQLPIEVMKASYVMTYHLAKMTLFLVSGDKRDETLARTLSDTKDLSSVFEATTAAINRYVDCPEVITPVLFDIFTRNTARNIDEMLDAIATLNLV